MRSILITIVVLGGVLSGPVTFAQALSAEDAQAKLAAKDQQRRAERNQSIQMTAGELSDLQARIRQLEAEVGALRSQLNQKEVAGKPSARRTMIEIGMTKAEVMAFVNRDKSLRITGMSANAGINKSSQQVIVRGSSSSNGNVTVTKNDDDPTRTRTQKELTGDSKTEVETVRNNGVSETIEIDKFQTTRQVTGSGPARGLGAAPDDIYSDVTRVTGHITVNLSDGVVASVVAR